MITLDDIFVFICVVESGSFIAAAKKLRMPASTVSRRIVQLEGALNTQLIERTSRKMQVTEKGKVFYSQCSPQIHLIKESVNGFVSQKNTMSGKIKMTVPTFLGSEVLSKSFVAFSKKYKSIELEIVLSNRYEDIIDEDIDFAIRVGPLKDSNYISQHLLTSYFVLCAGPGFLKGKGKIKTPQELTSHPFILTSHMPDQWNFQHKKTMEMTSVKVHGNFKSNDIILSRNACREGLGFAFLPKLSADACIESGELIQVLKDFDVLLKRDIHIIYPSKKYLSKKAMTLIQFLKENQSS